MCSTIEKKNQSEALKNDPNAGSFEAIINFTISAKRVLQRHDNNPVELIQKSSIVGLRLTS